MEKEDLISKITQEVINKLNLNNNVTLTCSSSKDGKCTSCQFCVVNNTSGVKSLISSGASRIGSTLGVPRVPADVANYIDHTLLRADATQEMVQELCAEAANYGFYSVCINPYWIPLAKKLLRRTNVKVCTVIGFPLGANSPRVKEFETRNAIGDGADEVDMVINIGALKSKNYDLVEEDIRSVVRGTRGNVISKVILETCLLTYEEKVKGCELSKSAGADFVKTSTGFSSGGATAADISLMRQIVGPGMGVKASGGVRDFNDAIQMIQSGASRIGASASVKIVTGQKGTGAY